MCSKLSPSSDRLETFEVPNSNSMAKAVVEKITRMGILGFLWDTRSQQRHGRFRCRDWKVRRNKAKDGQSRRWLSKI